MEHKVLRLPEVKKITGLSRSCIYKMISLGTFPKPISLGARSVGWLESEINDWLNAKIQARASSKNIKTPINKRRGK